MKIYALICHKLNLTQFWPKVASWRFEITTDEPKASQEGIGGEGHQGSLSPKMREKSAPNLKRTSL